MFVTESKYLAYKVLHVHQTVGRTGVTRKLKSSQGLTWKLTASGQFEFHLNIQDTDQEDPLT
jgi:hypothetical protein